MVTFHAVVYVNNNTLMSFVHSCVVTVGPSFVDLYEIGPYYYVFMTEPGFEVSNDVSHILAIVLVLKGENLSKMPQFV